MNRRQDKYGQLSVPSLINKNMLSLITSTTWPQLIRLAGRVAKGVPQDSFWRTYAGRAAIAMFAELAKERARSSNSGVSVATFRRLGNFCGFLSDELGK